MNARKTSPIRHRPVGIQRLLRLSLWTSLTFSGGFISGQVPDGPPDIEPTSFRTFSPEPLRNRVIPPFNAADPGSTILAVGQMVELMVVVSQPDEAEIQWVKDRTNLSGKTGTSIHIAEVSHQDAGAYRADVISRGAAAPSSEVEFEILMQAEIDDVLATWSNRFFTFEERDDPTISGAVADPDMDGLDNLIEYFFGSNPTRSSTPPEMAVTDSVGSRISFSYSRTQERTDLVHTVQGSDLLREWIPLTVTKTTVTPIDESTERVAVELEWPFETAFPRFIRLLIEQAVP